MWSFLYIDNVYWLSAHLPSQHMRRKVYFHTYTILMKEIWTQEKGIWLSLLPRRWEIQRGRVSSMWSGITDLVQCSSVRKKAVTHWTHKSPGPTAQQALDLRQWGDLRSPPPPVSWAKRSRLNQKGACPNWSQGWVSITLIQLSDTSCSGFGNVA